MLDALKRSVPPFVSAAVRNPKAVGAAAPSSRALAARMASAVPDGVDTPTVVEIGAGTGAFTRVASERVAGGGRYIAIEQDERMADHLERTIPGVEVVNGDAAELGKILADRGVTSVDAVLCGLPWSLFTVELQRRILGEISTAMAPHAVFTTFAYVHAARIPGSKRFRSEVEAVFEEVEVQSPVWRNLPPAMTYLCRGARGTD
ncbi:MULTISPECIES: class I SAM-dependent methyltransferase [Prauserella salsuginis group]|uniref:Phospholipid N-methyltransferase n=2 Tax=Prauserella salsuginis group TaxID=2893672 RepID=A0A839XMM5_9PSEU|nr:MULTISPECIES: methyltransferase domain-containing protein [Prauserella salsuginis group]MBB3663991.1 phospholipid N-methyltransferase [Prauserella sediminis]MCR3721446.1 Phospholipid N-methyltransferase [Prauserella flava]MCR3732436.1 Phospholipid N-methyltransferase [Prauserella salsuginis]